MVQFGIEPGAPIHPASGPAAERPYVRPHGARQTVIVFRCTQRLAKRLRVALADDALPSTGVLGDWYANSLNVGHSRYVLCLSARTLLPVILPARKSEFPGRFPDYLSEVLDLIGVPSRVIEREAAEAAQPVFAKTQNRSLLGSLNDFVFSASVYLQHGESVLEANLKLAQMPSKVIEFAFPSEVAREALLSQNHR
jgi:hypothetical protein